MLPGGKSITKSEEGTLQDQPENQERTSRGGVLSSTDEPSPLLKELIKEGARTDGPPFCSKETNPKKRAKTLTSKGQTRYCPETKKKRDVGAVYTIRTAQPGKTKPSRAGT